MIWRYHAQQCALHCINWRLKASSFRFPIQAGRLRALEDKNGKLKRMLANAILDNVALTDLLGKKWERPLLSGRPSHIW